MKRLLWVAGFGVVVVVALFVALVFLVDAEDLGAALAAQAEEGLGQPVSIGSVDFSLFPMPEVRLDDVVVGDAAAPLAVVPVLRARISLLSALTGRVVLTSVEAERPQIQIPVDRDGRPVFPARKQSATRPAGPDGIPGDASESAASEEASSELAVAVHRFSVREGTVEVGPFRIEKLGITGSLGLDRSLTLDVDAHLVDIGTVSGAHVEITDLAQDVQVVEVDGQLEDVDLAGLNRRFNLERDVAGTLDGPFRIRHAGGELRELDFKGNVRELVFRSGTLSVEGDVPIEAKTGGAWEVDLRACTVRAGDSVQKPRGEALALSGTLNALSAKAAFDDMVLVLAESKLPLSLSEKGGQQVLEIGAGEIELEPLASWVNTDALGLHGSPSGRFSISSMRVVLDPLSLAGEAALEDVILPLEHASLSLAGPLRAKGTRIIATDLAATLAEQVLVANGSYDLAAGELRASLKSERVQIEPLLEALTGSANLLGLLSFDVDLRGPPDLSVLAGSGTVEISPGQVRGFSIMQQVLGELSGLPVIVAALRGKDLSKYDDEKFESLKASFQMHRGLLRVQPMVVVYRSGTATLRGTVGMLDGALDLSGVVEISRELDTDLAGQPTREAKIIPIAGIGGTIGAPRVRIDQRAIASVAATYGVGGRVGELLEERIGPEGAEAVKGLLEGILGGGRRQAPPQQPAVSEPPASESPEPELPDGPQEP